MRLQVTQREQLSAARMRPAGRRAKDIGYRTVFALRILIWQGHAEERRRIRGKRQRLTSLLAISGLIGI